MIQRASILASSSLALALVACGGDGGGSLDKASDAFNASVEASCQKAFDCMSSYDPAMNNNTPFADSYGASVDDCVAQTKALITQFLGADFFAKLDASVAAGRIIYDSGDAQVCLDAGAAQTCDQFFGQNGATYTAPPECDTTFAGTVATGSACTIDNDCATDGDNCDPTAMTCG